VVALLCFFLRLLASPFRSNSRLEAENAALRQQLIVLQRKVRGRAEFTNGERLFFIQLYRWFPSILKVMTTIRPETLVRWHRGGFRRYWRWKSRNPGGRPRGADPTNERRELARLGAFMSALPPRADMCTAPVHVLSLPKISSGSRSALKLVKIPCSRVQIPCSFAKFPCSVE
jgi:hypothetical protein